jgi:hypothetical protein
MKGRRWRKDRTCEGNGLKKIAVAEVKVPIVGSSDGNGRFHLRNYSTSPDSQDSHVRYRNGGEVLGERYLQRRRIAAHGMHGAI